MFIINIIQISTISLLLTSTHSYQHLTRSISIFKSSNKNQIDSKKYCVDTKVNPLPQPEGQYRTDADTTWQTINKEEIVPIPTEKFNVRPQLITFDAYNTLFQPSQSIGRWYREVLNDVCDMRIRLPRPALFNHAFKSVYSSM